MKTAMQELIDRIEEEKELLSSSLYGSEISGRLIGLSFVKRIATELLEKEKNQIISFGKKMQLIQHISYDDDVTFCFDPEKNYNETYQNKS